MDQSINIILNKLNQAVFIKDQQSRLVMVNDAFCEMVNMTRESMIGRTLAEHVPQDEQEMFLKVDRHVIKTGESRQEHETMTFDNSEKKHIVTHKARHVDEEGKVFLIGIINDITATVKSRQIMEKKSAALKDLNQHKDRILSIISHDLQGPINNILSLVELQELGSEDLGSQPGLDFTKRVEGAAIEAKNMLSRLISWSRTRSSDLDPSIQEIQLDPFLSEIYEATHRHASTKDIEVSFQFEGISHIFSDERLLRVIIRNLLQNAIKFTEKGGAVTLEMRLVEENVFLTVEDNGVGISQEALPKLFLPGQGITTAGTARERGSGLGLKLCREFTEALKGEIWAKSEKGKGSAFHVSLPQPKTD